MGGGSVLFVVGSIPRWSRLVSSI